MAPSVKAARKVLAAVEVLQALRGAQPEPRQRSVLEQFPGWGPAASLFDPQPTGQWAALADHLDDLAGDDIRIPARLVDTAFYTPPALITHIYDLLRSAEFAGGPVLDLGCGTGRFLQHAPADLQIAYTGVELDPFAARIAATLHPDAYIITGALQSVTLPNNHFAAAIGNVPFASTKVSDAAISFYGNLHSYFLVRAVRAVRPGNLHDKVTITAFAVERSFDAFMFGTAERKSRSFEQLSRADSQVREIEDIGGEQTMSFAELKAAAAGNPLLLRQHQLRNDIRRLKLQHLTVRQNVTAALDEAAVADADANADEYRATTLAELCDYRSSLRPADFSHLADHIYIREIRHARAWSSGPMCVKLDRASGGKQLLTISFGYRDLWSEVLPPKIRRQGVAAVREWAHGIYQEHLDCAENERDSLRARAAHRRARAAELRAAADATDLSSPPALVAAEAELVEVNRRIDEDLLTDDQGEPTAA